MKVAFRVDAGTAIGSGHLSRCLTLAEELITNGVTQCFFIMRAHKGSYAELITKKGYEVKLLPLEISPNYSANYEQWVGANLDQDAHDALEYLSALDFGKSDWLIIDHYGIDHQFEEVVGSLQLSIGVIDDLVNRRHKCDLLIDQTCGRMPTEYNGLVPNNCNIMAGSDYCMLRPEFQELREEARLRRKTFTKLESLFINFGSTDPTNATTPILNILNALELNDDIKLVVAVGSGTPQLAEIRNTISKSKYIVELHVDANNMSELMLRTDVAIGAAGATTWERSALGLPSILIKTAENQNTVIDRAINLGIAIQFGIETKETSEVLQSCFDAVVNNYSDMSEKCFALVDTNGTKKIVNHLMGDI